MKRVPVPAHESRRKSGLLSGNSENKRKPGNGAVVDLQSGLRPGPYLRLAES